MVCWKCILTAAILEHVRRVVLSLYRSGPTFPPWGSTRMENTSWPSWRSTIWRTASTWVLSVALLTASCKPTPPRPPAWNYVYNLIYSSPPHPPIPVRPFRRHCAHCPPPNPTQWGCLCTPVSTITLREEPVATGSLSFCQILLPLPHLRPDLLNWGREGREVGSGERGNLLHSLFRSLPFFSLSFTFFSDKLKNYFTFCYCCTHNPLVPSSHPSYLPLWDGTSI